jgi:glycosyltransferase involved in cell wall biosynthesis
MRPKISVVVPVYNNEKYLRQCVDSILVQTINDFELLLIDDGSIDSSGAICDEYSAQDSRVRVFHKKNGGVSSARNLGLDNVRGDWVIFCDSDDYWCEITTLELLYGAAVKNDIDIIRGDYKYVDDKGEGLYCRQITNSKKDIANKVISNLMFLNEVVQGEYYLWLCLIRKQALGDLVYNENKVYLEDSEFFLSLCSKPLKCMYIDKMFYAYRKHESAITVRYHPQKLHDAFDFSRFCFSLSKLIEEKDMSVFLVNQGAHNLFHNIHFLVDSSRNYKELREAFDCYSIRELKRMMALTMSWENLSFRRVLLLILPLPCYVRILRAKLRFFSFLS